MEEASVFPENCYGDLKSRTFFGKLEPRKGPENGEGIERRSEKQKPARRGRNNQKKKGDAIFWCQYTDGTEEVGAPFFGGREFGEKDVFMKKAKRKKGRTGDKNQRQKGWR